MKKITLFFTTIISIAVFAQQKSTGTISLSNNVPITANFTLNNTTSQVTLVLTGPSDRWFGLGIGIVSGFGMDNGDVVVFTTATTPNLTETTTYYVDAFEIGCTTGTRTAVTATINQIPTVTIVDPNPVCGENSTVLTASTTAGTINWYAVETGGTILGTGTSFTTPILSEDTTFYAEGINNGCSSGNRIPILVQVYDLPDVEDETVTLCEGTVITLNAGVSTSSLVSRVYIDEK